MSPDDVAKIARDSGWKNEDYMKAIYNLSKDIVNPSGNGETCFICAGEKVYMGKPCENCDD